MTRVVIDGRATMFCGLCTVVRGIWLQRAFSFFVNWASCSESVVSRQVLALIQLFLLVLWLSLLMTRSDCRVTISTDWVAPRFDFWLVAFSITWILYHWKRLRWLMFGLGACLIRHTKVWLFNRIILSRCKHVFMTIVVALGEFLVCISCVLTYTWLWRGIIAMAVANR